MSPCTSNRGYAEAAYINTSLSHTHVLHSCDRYYKGSSSKIYATGAITLAGSAYLSVSNNQILNLGDMTTIISVIQYAINKNLVAADPNNGVYVLVPANNAQNQMDPDFCTK